MRFCLAGFLIFLTLRESVAFGPANEHGRVSVKSNPSPNVHREYHRALKKYGFQTSYQQPVSYNKFQTPRRRQIGETGASITNDTSAYGSVVTVGEGMNAKSFNILFDTGSADFWLYSTLFLDPEQFEGNMSHSIYDPHNSITAISADQVFVNIYGLGDAGGVVFLDTISFAGFELKNQSVEATMFTDPLFVNPQSFELDGIFGLYALGPTNVFPPPQNMILESMFFTGSNTPKEKVFTALLTRPGEPDGFYTFGFIDQDFIGNTTINFTPFAQTTVKNVTGFWNVPVPAAIINGERVANNDGLAIIDTGTTLILLPDNILEVIYKPLNGVFDNTTGLWLFPSNFTENQLPSVNLPVAEFNLTLQPTDIIFDNSSIPGMVVGSIQSNTGTNISVYGDIWLRNVYAIFDLGSGNASDFQFGFVPRQPSIQNM